MILHTFGGSAIDLDPFLGTHSSAPVPFENAMATVMDMAGRDPGFADACDGSESSPTYRESVLKWL